MSPRPRITWIVPTMRVGGTELQLLHLMQGLSDDFDLNLICTRSEGALIGDARRIGAHVRVMDTVSGWDPRIQRRLYRILRVHTPQIVHSYLSGFDFWANRAAWQNHVPVIISSRRELASWQKRRHLWMQRLGNQYVDCIIANSNAVAAYAAGKEGFPRDRYKVIYNGVKADSFVSKNTKIELRRRFKLPEKALVVGMVANFSPVKDHRLFLDMARILLKQRSDVHFLLVGTGPLANTIRASIDRHRQHLFITVMTSVGEVADLYSAMDVAVLTSKVEGFPNTLLEAMASHTAPVAASVGGVSEIIQDGQTGILVDSRNPEDFARAVAGLLDNPEKRIAIGQRAGAWVRETLPMEAMVRQHKELYFQLLDEKLRPGG
ncbi:MAG: glycosyltransferase [Candidatus Hydrogenedentes bacterium]|nr:glycosyltransferase [Candidatus Hydrogenedentota bacterium]